MELNMPLRVELLFFLAFLFLFLFFKNKYECTTYLFVGESSLHIIGYLGTTKTRKFMFYGFSPKSKQQGYGQHHPFTPTVLSKRCFGGKRNTLQ